MPHRLVRGDAGDGPAPGRLDGRGDRAHLLLDRRQPDHRVQLGHGVLDRDLRRGQRRGGLVVARGVLGVGQRRGLGPGAVTGGAGVALAGEAAAGVRRLRRARGARVGGSAGPAALPGAVQAVHPVVLMHALGQPPAERDRGEQPGRDHADERRDVPGAQLVHQDGDDEHRPHQHQGGRAARYVPPAQPAQVRHDRDHHRQRDQRQANFPGRLAAVEAEEVDEPDRDHGHVGRGHAGADLIDDRDRGEHHAAEQHGDQDDHDPAGKRSARRSLLDPFDEVELFSRGGLDPVVWRHIAPSSLVPASQPRLAPGDRVAWHAAPAPGCRTVVCLV